MKGSIYCSRAGCGSQMLFNDVGCSYHLSFVSLHIEVVVSVEDCLAEATIINWASRDLPMVIGNFCYSSVTATYRDGMVYSSL